MLLTTLGWSCQDIPVTASWLGKYLNSFVTVSRQLTLHPTGYTILPTRNDRWLIFRSLDAPTHVRNVLQYLSLWQIWTDITEVTPWVIMFVSNVVKGWTLATNSKPTGLKTYHKLTQMSGGGRASFWADYQFQLYWGLVCILTFWGERTECSFHLTIYTFRANFCQAIILYSRT